MPHLAIQHSSNVPEYKLQTLCEVMLAEIAAIGLYPLAGIRVRTIACAASAIADGHPRNMFVDMIFRIAAGRSEEDRKRTGEMLMQAAERHFAVELSETYFALSLEIVEINANFSWKTNTIHNRLKGTP
jgi:5-carboxymethyl-2-hydroxymuconate isomerase